MAPEFADSEKGASCFLVKMVTWAKRHVLESHGN